MVDKWLCANKLCLNIEKTNFIVFHQAQKKINYSLILKMQEQQIREKQSIKYLGIFIDSHLNWKSHILELSKKISRGIGIILAKLRHFVSIQILLQMYNAIIYSFLTYAVLLWGNTYITNLSPLITLQKKAIRIITFSDYRAHTSPSLKMLNLLKLLDIVKSHTGIFMLCF